MPASYSAGQQHLAASGLSARTPPGNPTPSSAVRTVKQFVRDPAVVAHVLHLSGGRCEHCGCEAPFKRADGTPYGVVIAEVDDDGRIDRIFIQVNPDKLGSVPPAP